jgi:uncharacterized protein
MKHAMTPPQQPLGSQPTPWWKVPHMWMVVGGPLIVVVAAVATFVIAVRHPDPVINKGDYERDLAGLQPAQQARNHAATGQVPEPRK